MISFAEAPVQPAPKLSADDMLKLALVAKTKFRLDFYIPLDKKIGIVVDTVFHTITCASCEQAHTYTFDELQNPF
jgi:hypothetical protein